jgi:hypothetical protein
VKLKISYLRLNLPGDVGTIYRMATNHVPTCPSCWIRGKEHEAYVCEACLLVICRACAYRDSAANKYTRARFCTDCRLDVA